MTDTLAAAIETVAADDPRAAREAVQEARARLDQAEGAAIRAALEVSEWRVKPAALLLGFPRHSALQKLVAPGGRQAAIGEEIERHREEGNFHMGRPRTTTSAPDAAPVDVPGARRRATSRRGRNAPQG